MKCKTRPHLSAALAIVRVAGYNFLEPLRSCIYNRVYVEDSPQSSYFVE